MNNQLSYEEQLSCYLKAYNSLDEEDKYCIDRCYDQLLGIVNHKLTYRLYGVNVSRKMKSWRSNDE